MAEESPSQHTSDSTESFITQVMEQQRSLYAFILSLTGVLSDADDVLQEVNLVLWRKRDEYQPGTNFQAWALSIAKFQVLAWQKRQSRERVQFCADVVERLANAAASRCGDLDERRNALAACLQKLPENDRFLLHQRYSDGMSVLEISESDGRTRDGIYYALSKVHERLRECVRRQLRNENS